MTSFHTDNCGGVLKYDIVKEFLSKLPGLCLWHNKWIHDQLVASNNVCVYVCV